VNSSLEDFQLQIRIHVLPLTKTESPGFFSTSDRARRLLYRTLLIAAPVYEFEP